MRGYALGFGYWASTLQMAQIYSLSFLHSATARAYLGLMLCWFLGSAVGSWLPNRSSRTLVWVALALYAVNLRLLQTQLAWVAPLAALSGGVCGGHWVVRWGKTDLAGPLSWESLGMAFGWMTCSLGLYGVGIGYLWTAPTLATLWVAWGEPREPE